MTGSPRERLARTLGFIRGRREDKELDEELAGHLAMAVEDNMRNGMSAEDARRLAALKFGSPLAATERAGDQRGLPALESFFKDLGYVLRGMRRSPGFTTLAVVMLAVGIGVNATVFTLTNTVLFKGFPLVERNDRILYISGSGGVSWPDFQDWRAQAQSFEGMAVVADMPVSLSDRSGFPESYNATRVSANAFQVVRQRPILGRDFAPSDEVPGAAPVAILSNALWVDRYGKDRAVIGRTPRINGVPTTVIGVMPEGFTFPQKQDLWVPLIPTAALQKRDARGLWFAFGRMAGDVTFQSARVEMETIGKRLAKAYPATNRNYLPGVETFTENFIGRSAPLIYRSMWGAVGFVLLIACANLANLMLARAMGRSREISVRMALGAGRWRIVRQLLMESVALSLAGGFFGWWIARFGVRLWDLVARPPSWFDHVLTYTVDYRVFAYLIAISAITGVLFGLAPALRLSRLNLNTALKDGGRSATGGGAGRDLSTLLVIAEMALAVVLLAGAGVMIRSFLNMYAADLGVGTAHVLTMQLSLPAARYPTAESRALFHDRLRERLESAPGVESVALTNALPAYGSQRPGYELAGAAGQADTASRPKLSALIVSPAYFRTLGALLRAGRDFNDSDDAKGAPVAIVNERLASRLWPGENPLGKRLRLFDGAKPEAWRTVVGVVSNIVQYRGRPEFNALVYLPYRQTPAPFMIVVARTRLVPVSTGMLFRRAVQAIDADLPVSWLVPLSERLSWSYSFNGGIAVLFVAFAAIALLLASIGLYAAIAHSVSRRTQEVGIRMAIGATAGDVLRLVFRQGLVQAGAGLAIGLAASLAVNRVLKAELVQVSPSDPATLIVVSAILILAAALGCWIPARRAMRVDPVVALRQE